MNFVNNMILNAVNSIHTAYLGKVIRINGNKAIVQPLSRYQEAGQDAAQQAVVSALILNNARYKLRETSIESTPVITATEIQAGDVVLCVVCERDITGQANGQVTTPDSTMNYSLSNSVIVGVV